MVITLVLTGKPIATGLSSERDLLDHAQQMAAHESARTTMLYDRRSDKITLDEVERIVLQVIPRPAAFRGGEFTRQALAASTRRRCYDRTRASSRFTMNPRDDIRPNLVKAIGPVRRCGAAQAALWSAKKLSGGSASSGAIRGSKRNRVAH
jgi:hypothetical protein